MKLQNLIHVLIGIVCIGLLPQVQAVSPAPDGCYPNYTTAEGCNALAGLGAGFGNTGIGWYSLFAAGDSNFNTGVGAGALALNNADSNTAVGAVALLLNTTGTLNTAVGTDALVHNDSGSDNNAFGAFALFDNNGDFNDAYGRIALTNNADGIENNAFGDRALRDNVSGSHNTAMGDDALLVSTGDDNTAMGEQAGNDIIDGHNDVAVGSEAGTGIVHGSNTIAINVPGVSSVFGDADNTCYVGSIYNEPIGGAGTPHQVWVDADGVLGFNPSSKRFKHDIKSMDKASETLYGLKPVTFKYNSDKKGTPQYGLIAEDVADVNPDLVLHDNSGKISSVRYDQVDAMLLNEFLKARRQIDAQQKQIDALTAGLEKVSEHLEARKPAPQVVNNP